MKKTVKMLGLMVAMVMGSAAEAGTFNMQVEAYINPLQITAVATNVYGEPIQCRVRVAGLTQCGNTIWADVMLTLPSGAMEYAYAYTNYYCPFIDGRAEAVCQTIGY